MHYMSNYADPLVRSTVDYCACLLLSGMVTVLLCANRFHDRTFDVGIAEQHAVTFAAGLACEGLRPFCAIYSTFLQRGYDQIIHDVALQDLPGER